MIDHSVLMTGCFCTSVRHACIIATYDVTMKYIGYQQTDYPPLITPRPSWDGSGCGWTTWLCTAHAWRPGGDGLDQSRRWMGPGAAGARTAPRLSAEALSLVALAWVRWHASLWPTRTLAVWFCPQRLPCRLGYILSAMRTEQWLQPIRIPYA